MCGKTVIDWDTEFDEVLWTPCVHPEIPEPFRIACCPDCGNPMVFDDGDGKEYVYIRMDEGFFKLWTTLSSPSNTSQNSIQ